MRQVIAFALLLILLFIGHDSGAGETGEGIPSESWPASWSQPLKTASESGLTRFREAPVLAERVKRGEIPPLSGRLPNDPVVVEPLERIGRYGGVMRVFDRDGGLVTGLENPLTIDPAVRAALPNLASGWEYSDGGRTLTLFLRPGLRWSDGHLFTAENFVFWHRHILLNRDLTPVIRPQWQGMTVTAPDSRTVRYTFRQPYPFFIQEMAHHGAGFFTASHFMKDYHPDFVDRKTLEARATKEGFISWMAYFNAVNGDGLTNPSGVPTMNAFVLKRKSPTLLVYERNPYYFKVDPAGNQLPYVDEIMAQVVRNPEVVTARTSAGQAHFSANGLKTADIPLFKRGEKTNRITTYIWNRLHGVDVVIQPNLTCEDVVLRRIFQDFRFRRALSIAINRDEINAIVYFNRGAPRQTTVIPSSMFYEKAFSDAHIEYDPATARVLLDAMGLIDRDGDGVRERPDGAPLRIALEWVDIETPKQATMELVTEYWRQVGIDLHLKQVDGSLQSSRARGNLMQMTLWHADRTSDILFPPEPFWFVPMHTGWEECHWTPWSTWYLSGGKEGQEPPFEIRKLIDRWEAMSTTMDEGKRVEYGKNILRSQAENLWTIGTVGLAPQPVVVSHALRNVPRRGYWGWDNRWTLPYHPETWFLDEG